MEKIYTKEYYLSPIYTDDNGKLSLYGCLNLFMDIAIEQTEILQNGLSTMLKKGLFTITAKNKVYIYKDPAIGEKIEVSTWQECVNEHRLIKDYRISKDGITLVEGKTEFALLDIKTNKVVNTKDYYSTNLNVKDENFKLSDFEKIDIDFNDQVDKTYRVKSIDIDLGGHMNNAVYLRAFQSLFTNAEWNKLNLKAIEIVYLKPCHENDNLNYYIKKTDDSMFVKVTSNNNIICLMKAN